MPLADHKEPRTVCWTCALPDDLLAEVEENESKHPAERIPRRAVVKWLQEEHGLRVSTDSLYKHFAFGHRKVDA